MKKTFKNIARDKQANYFAEKYGIKEFGTVRRKPTGYPEAKDFKVKALLKWEDAKDGKIFYEGYRQQILDEIERRKAAGSYAPSALMMCHALRSEHMPWNIFYPMSLSDDMKNHAKDIFNAILEKVSPTSKKIKEIIKIWIEFAPKDETAKEEPFTQCYLNDRTSFDTYIEYIAEDGEKGGIGIEVKYTEKGYQPGEKEKKATIIDYKNPKYRYLDVMKKSGYFIPKAFKREETGLRAWSPLVRNELRQIWRNHLLGASMVQHEDLKYFLSLLVYPKGNTHFNGDKTHNGAVRNYKQWLSPDGQKTWKAITFEELFQLIQENYTDPEGTAWVNYLKERYLF